VAVSNPTNTSSDPVKNSNFNSHGIAIELYWYGVKILASGWRLLVYISFISYPRAALRQDDLESISVSYCSNKT
jgi:hypothetical protein